MSRKPDTSSASSTCDFSRREFLVAAASAVSVSALQGCGVHEHAALPPVAPAIRAGAEQVSLGSVGAAHGLLTGFALSVSGIRDSSAYRRTVSEQCSIVVAENAMKWAPLRPAPDRFFFDDADALVLFA